MAQGDLTAARTAYQAGLDIRTGWRPPIPATRWQRDLSVSHNKIGDLAAAQGDLTAARTAYQAGLDIASRLAAAIPATPSGNATCRSATRRSATCGCARRPDRGATPTRRAWTSGQAGGRDPGNTEWQRDLVISCWTVSSSAR